MDLVLDLITTKACNKTSFSSRKKNETLLLLQSSTASLYVLQRGVHHDVRLHWFAAASGNLLVGCSVIEM